MRRSGGNNKGQREGEGRSEVGLPGCFSYRCSGEEKTFYFLSQARVREEERRKFSWVSKREGKIPVSISLSPLRREEILGSGSL